MSCDVWLSCSMNDSRNCYHWELVRCLAIVFADSNVAVIGKPFAELDKSTISISTVNFAPQGRARAVQLRLSRARPALTGDMANSGHAAPLLRSLDVVEYSHTNTI